MRNHSTFRFDSNDDYRPRFPFKNGDWNTIFSSLFRKVEKVPRRRIKITTDDGDFVYLDRFHFPESFIPDSGNRKCIVLLCHGFEGNSDSSYIHGQASALIRAGFSVAAINYRGCGGSSNLLKRYYSGGDTGDIRRVIKHLSEEFPTIIPVGFSLGGNLVLKLLSEKKIPDTVTGGVAVSVPFHLKGAVERIQELRNFPYHIRFLLTLWKKIIMKSSAHPEFMSFRMLFNIVSIRTYDRHITAPDFGYSSEDEYYRDASSLYSLSSIKRPALVISALDDPFLSSDSYPDPTALNNDMIKILYTQYGGHCGFYNPQSRESWSETRIVHFIQRLFDTSSEPKSQKYY